MSIDYLYLICMLFQIRGVLRNTGQTLVLTVDRASPVRVNISGGPFTYRYQFEELYIRFGPEDVVGSEHLIHGIAFPAEVSSFQRKKEKKGVLSNDT